MKLLIVVLRAYQFFPGLKMLVIAINFHLHFAVE